MKSIKRIVPAIRSPQGSPFFETFESGAEPLINLVGSYAGASFSRSTQFKVQQLRVVGGTLGGRPEAAGGRFVCTSPSGIPKWLHLDLSQTKCKLEAVSIGSRRLGYFSSYVAMPDALFVKDEDGAMLLQNDESWYLERRHLHFNGRIDQDRILLNTGVWSPREGSLAEFEGLMAFGPVIDSRLIGMVERQDQGSLELIPGVFTLDHPGTEPEIVERWPVRTDVVGRSSSSLLVLEEFERFKILDRRTLNVRASWEINPSLASDWVAFEAGIIEGRMVPTFRSWETGEALWELDARPEAELTFRQYIHGTDCVGEFRHNLGTRWVFHVIDPMTGNALSTIEGEWPEATRVPHLSGMIPCGPKAFLVVAPKVCLHFSWDD